MRSTSDAGVGNIDTRPGVPTGRPDPTIADVYAVLLDLRARLDALQRRDRPAAAELRRASSWSGIAPANQAITSDALNERIVEEVAAQVGPMLRRDGVSPGVAPDAASGRTRVRSDEWLTAPQAARHLGMASVKALYTAVARRQVPVCRLGRRLRFSRAALDHVLTQRQRRRVEQLPRVPSPGKESERW